MRLSLLVDAQCGTDEDRAKLEDSIRTRLPGVNFVKHPPGADVEVRWVPVGSSCAVEVESTDGIAEVPLRSDADDRARSEAASRVAWLAAIGMGIDPFDLPIVAEPEPETETEPEPETETEPEPETETEPEPETET
ncbi:MAG: hypothetical protein ACJAYU_005095, partial [Bradymonadia bacterium]